MLELHCKLIYIDYTDRLFFSSNYPTRAECLPLCAVFLLYSRIHWAEFRCEDPPQT